MVNEALREEHLAQMNSERARAMYDRLCDACDRRTDGLTDADQMIVADICYEEQIKEMFQKDIAERGIGQERSNGRQRYWQENKSPAQIRALSEQQRKHLSELKLTPAGRKAASVEIDDDFDAFT